MESVSRLSSLLESARDLTIDAATSSSLGRAVNHRSRDLSFVQIKKLLESRHDREVLEGLRKVISMMCQSRPCLPYFSAVVKNVASPNIEIKKLVYIYLLHHAESEPDLALLSINTIQKSLSDQNAQVRAMALRVMSGIRVPVISQIVSLAIKKGCADLSPHVRKAAALAIPKCYALDPNTLPQLLEYLSQLLGDKQYYVVGSAVAAFLEVCPDRIDLVHRHYRPLVRKLVDMDDWGQLATIRLIAYYSRKCFPRRYAAQREETSDDFYKDGAKTEDASRPQTLVIDPDLELFLKACKQLLTSRNPAVILAVARCCKYLGTPEDIEWAIRPLVSLLRSPRHMHQIILYNLVTLCIDCPRPFVAYIPQFLLSAQDSPDIWRLKVELLTLVFPHCDTSTKGVILSEFEHFSNSDDDFLVRESVRAIGRCANDDSASKRCLYLLLNQTSSADGILVGEALNVVRKLIQQDPKLHKSTIIRLAKHLDTMDNPEARANVIWLVGEFASVGDSDSIAPDVLRILVQSFADESESAKQQILLLAARVYLHQVNLRASSKPLEEPTPDNAQEGTAEQAQEISEEDPVTIIWEHVLLIARYDISYDLRDRARLYKALLADPANTQMGKLLLLAPKPVPHIPSPSESRKHLLLGSATLVAGEEAGPVGLSGYEDLPQWVRNGDEPDPKLRDEPERAGQSESSAISASQRLDSAMKEKEAVKPSSFASGNKDKTLDDWLAEEEPTEQEEAEESEGSTESESEEETSSEEESD